ncbi:hypothetical protein EIQ04_09755 [Xanthomonas campestris pv. raphani]
MRGRGVSPPGQAGDTTQPYADRKLSSPVSQALAWCARCVGRHPLNARGNGGVGFPDIDIDVEVFAMLPARMRFA